MQGDKNPMRDPNIRQKISEAQKGIPRPYQRGENNPSKRPEVKEKISAALKGKPHPWQQGDKHYMHNPENAAKWSAYLKSLGENHPSKRPEVQEKIRQSRLGKKASEETKQKMSNRLLALGENHWMKQPEYRIWMKEQNPMKTIMADPAKYEEWKKKHDIIVRSEDYLSSVSGKKNHFYGKTHSDITKQIISNFAKVRYKNPENHPNWKGGITAERPAFYESDAWKYVAPLVWQRDKATCQRCGKIYNRKTYRFIMDIHHIIPFEYKEYRALMWNLILLCRKCHKIVHGKKNVTCEFLPDEYSRIFILS
jgi:hypothetical protein